MTPAPTAAQPVTVAVIRTDANVRSGPGTDSPIVATARQGARLVVAGRNNDAAWLQVTLPDGKSGWISAGAAQLEVAAPPPATVPAPTAPPPTPASTPDAAQPVTVAVIRTDANVRSGPGTDSPIVATARQGARLVVTGRNNDASWLQVTLPDGKSGWISAGAAQLEVAAPPPMPPTPTGLPANATRPTVTATATVATSGDLQIESRDPRYRCVQAEWRYRGDDGNLEPLWGYRSFSVTLFIQNNGVEPLVPPWGPRRWIITDGKVDSISDLTWGRVDSSAEFSWQPTIKPGQYIGWSFSAFPIDRNQWVKALEFSWQGRLYRLELNPTTPDSTINYADCGNPIQHTIRATPTPRP